MASRAALLRSSSMNPLLINWPANSCRSPVEPTCYCARTSTVSFLIPAWFIPSDRVLVLHPLSVVVLKLFQQRSSTTRHLKSQHQTQRRRLQTQSPVLLPWSMLCPETQLSQKPGFLRSAPQRLPQPSPKNSTFSTTSLWSLYALLSCCTW